MKQLELQVFKNEEVGELKGFMKDGQPWFLAGNVCRALGIKNSRDAVKSIRERFEIAGIKGVGTSYTLIETKGGKQETLIISEPYLYELIFTSRKQKAIKFRSWVTTEVLPALREHGEYRMKSKLLHRTYTDAIKEEICESIPKQKQGHIYSKYQIIINSSLGLPSRNNKDALPIDVLQKIMHREDLVKALITENKSYEQIKTFLQTLS